MQIKRCADCGMLGARDPDSSKLLEVDVDAREHGHARRPIFCGARAADIQAEASAAGGRLLPVLQRERDCNEFFTWRRGMDPKEHRFLFAAVEERRLVHDERMANLAAEERRRTQEASTQWWRMWTDRIWEILILLLGAYVGWLLREK
jgi:hypothetical protein